MYVATSNQMREIDKRAMNYYGIPSIVLMENAAHSVVNYIKRIDTRKILIICGTGNNGGDGFAVARILKINGYGVNVYCFGDINKLSYDAKINFDILNKIGIEVKKDINQFVYDIKESDVIVDAIFGTGFKGEIKEDYAKAVEIINKSGKYIISVDIPSGVESDTGKASDIHIKANTTITFGCLKYGHILGEGRDSTGNVLVENISIPYECIKDQGIKTTTNYGIYPKSLLKKRDTDTNKSDYGKVFIIGGSYNMSGAVALCAKASLKTGSGLVSCVIPKSIADRVGAIVPEATYIICDEKEGCINVSKETLDYIIDEADVIALGIGLKRAPHLFYMVEYIINNSIKPVIIDADGLNVLSENKDILKSSKGKIIITPHPGEMSRLTGYTTKYINENRVKSQRIFQKNITALPC